MGESDQLGFLRKQVRQQICAQMPFVVNREDLQDRPFALAHHLPGNDIGVVFRLGNQDFIARFYERFPNGKGYQIDGRRCAGGKDDFPTRGSMHMTGNGVPGAFISVCRLPRQGMNRPVDIGIVQRRQFLLPFHHQTRPHTGSRIVQIHKRFSVNRPPERGKMRAYFFYCHHINLQK